MTILRLLVLLACASALACGRRADEPKSAASEPKAAEAHTETDPNVVKIEAGMLRDLRITTDEVESRPGGEQITLLGELAVDERTYAEVGVPVVARVTRLLVNAGDSVRQGQTLAELTSSELGKARADYLSAEARVRLADAALGRKRGLAAEKIVPLREVQEAESQAAEARAALRSARAAIGAFGVQPPTEDADGPASSAFVLRPPCRPFVLVTSRRSG
jgi:membrane fusion protein, heavy metal efflux system